MFWVSHVVMHHDAVLGNMSLDHLPLLLWTLHFARRTAESAWLHQYGSNSVSVTLLGLQLG